MIGLSTSWFSNQKVSFREQIESSRKLGFTQVEIGHSTTPPDWSGASTALMDFDVKAPSLRIGCQEALAGDYRTADYLAASETGSRQRAQEAILKDIGLAKQTVSSKIFLGAGFVESPAVRDRVRDLTSALRLGEEEKSKEITSHLQQDLAEGRDPYLDRTCRSLFDIFQREPEVQLVLETPADPHFLPLPDELEGILDDLGKYPLAYCHDPGRAAVLEKTAGIPQGQWLERFVGKMVAIRLNDAQGVEAGFPPGSGEIDWKLIADYLPPGALRTLTIEPRHSPASLPAATKFLEGFGF